MRKNQWATPARPERSQAATPSVPSFRAGVSHPALKSAASERPNRQIAIYAATLAAAREVRNVVQ